MYQGLCSELCLWYLNLVHQSWFHFQGFKGFSLKVFCKNIILKKKNIEYMNTFYDNLK